MWEMVSLKRHALLSIDTLECLVFFKGIVIIVETSRGSGESNFLNEIRVIESTFYVKLAK